MYQSAVYYYHDYNLGYHDYGCNDDWCRVVLTFWFLMFSIESLIVCITNKQEDNSGKSILTAYSLESNYMQSFILNIFATVHRINLGFFQLWTQPSRPRVSTINGYKDMCMKVTSQSFWFHCKLFPVISSCWLGFYLVLIKTAAICGETAKIKISHWGHHMIQFETGILQHYNRRQVSNYLFKNIMSKQDESNYDDQ